MCGKSSGFAGRLSLKRCGPNTGIGEGDLPSMGSSSKFLPLICTRKAECPNQVILGCSIIADLAASKCSGTSFHASAPFVALLDRFVSQEETVEVRLHFKQQIRRQLAQLHVSAQGTPSDYRRLVQNYVEQKGEIDYGYLSQIFSK